MLNNVRSLAFQKVSSIFRAPHCQNFRVNLNCITFPCAIFTPLVYSIYACANENKLTSTLFVFLTEPLHAYVASHPHTYAEQISYPKKENVCPDLYLQKPEERNGTTAN